jgi:hypothetical protein
VLDNGFYAEGDKNSFKNALLVGTSFPTMIKPVLTL